MITNLIIVVIIIVVIFILFRIFKMIVTIIAIVLFLILAYSTNPNPPAHYKALKKKAQKSSVAIKDSEFKVSDLKIFSLTKLGKEGDRKIVGVGLFTQVMIFADLRQVD